MWRPQATEREAATDTNITCSKLGSAQRRDTTMSALQLYQYLISARVVVVLSPGRGLPDRGINVVDHAEPQPTTKNVEVGALWITRKIFYCVMVGCSKCKGGFLHEVTIRVNTTTQRVASSNGNSAWSANLYPPLSPGYSPSDWYCLARPRHKRKNTSRNSMKALTSHYQVVACSHTLCWQTYRTWHCNITT